MEAPEVNEAKELVPREQFAVAAEVKLLCDNLPTAVFDPPVIPVIPADTPRKTFPFASPILNSTVVLAAENVFPNPADANVPERVTVVPGVIFPEFVFIVVIPLTGVEDSQLVPSEVSTFPVVPAVDG